MRKHLTEQTAIFFSVSKWVFLSSIIGIVIGAIVTLFLDILHWTEHSRNLLPFHFYYTLPFILMLSLWLVKKFAPTAEGHGTEKVIEAVHKNYGKIDIWVIPVKLVTTVLTIFAGGSVGKEGPAAQIGAGAASGISDLLRFNKYDRKNLVICGIGAGFAAVFGTPIAGAIFGVEVLIIGVIKYDVLLPSFIAGFAAFTTTQFLGIEYTYYDVRFYENIALDLPLIFEVVVAGIFFGIVTDIFVTAVSWSHRAIKNIKLNPYLKAFFGGVILIIIASVFGDRYLGLGLNTIKLLLNHDGDFAKDIPWYAFLLKTFTTSISLAVGGSGGIITPIFYVGAASGHLIGMLLNEHIALFAALGFVSVVAGATNAPIAATIMAVELFGLEIAHYAALSAVISFLITGHRSVFSSQILAMKKSGILNVKIGKEIDDAEVKLEEKEINQIRDIRERLQQRRKKLVQTRQQNKIDKKRKKQNSTKKEE